MSTLNSKAGTGSGALLYISSTMPSPKLTFDDITNTSSPSQVTGTVNKEFVPTVLDPGEFSVTGIFLPSDPGLAAVQTAFYSGLANAFQVVLPEIAGQTTRGNVYQFNAYVQSLPQPTNVSAEKALTVKIDLKIVGLVTTATGS